MSLVEALISTEFNRSLSITIIVNVLREVCSKSHEAAISSEVDINDVRVRERILFQELVEGELPLTEPRYLLRAFVDFAHRRDSSPLEERRT